MITWVKTKTSQIWICLLFFSCIAHDSIAQSKVNFQNEFNYTAEAVSFSTPLGESDTDFLGKLHNQSSLLFGKKHILNLSLMIVHDNRPSLFKVRDLQTFSNLEAGNLYGFNEFFYQFKSDKFTLKVGHQDVNNTFLITQNGLLFAHSSMGIDPIATVNMPTPTYPFTSFAVTTNWKVNDHIRVRAGVFDGQYARPINKFLRLSWTMNKNDGFIYLFEPEITFLENRVSTKIGAYHHSGQFVKKDNSGIGKYWGFYSISDIVVSEIGNQSIHVYYQVHATTKSLSDLSLYFGAGVRFVNAIPIQCENELGIGLANASVNTDFTSVRNEYDIHGETVLEVNWKVKVNEKISLQPYFQYINIREIDVDLKEPIIVALRGYLTL